MVFGSLLAPNRTSAWTGRGRGLRHEGLASTSGFTQRGERDRPGDKRLWPSPSTPHHSPPGLTSTPLGNPLLEEIPKLGAPCNVPLERLRCQLAAPCGVRLDCSGGNGAVVHVGEETREDGGGLPAGVPGLCGGRAGRRGAWMSRQ